ncbi:MAG TPA: hypothetical protein VKB79_04600 [Bryobacteraceae bacterium]|nr:hypothetical protein [Bryobacteraceae bacterium]
MKQGLALIAAALAAHGIATLAASPAKDPKVKTQAAEESTRAGKPALWVEPTDIESRDLYQGPGPRDRMPTADTVFTFEKEDLNGTNPKYVIRDDKGNKWKAKLGDEAKPETVATRVVWAAGYFVDEDYFLPEIHVKGVPSDLKRGRKLIGADGTMRDVRLKLESKGRKKIGNWEWKNSPFAGSRELNGLRTLMSLINNWDLKDVNNAIFREKTDDGTRLLYIVSDLGASFGSPRFDAGYAHDKGDLPDYQKSKFIKKVTDTEVDFETPGEPSKAVILNPAQYVKRRELVWVGDHIPRADARWMGELLSRLSAQQLQDAFRAGGYSTEAANQFVTVVQDRIAQLKKL